MNLRSDDAAADRLAAKIRLVPDADGGGIDPAADGLSIALSVKGRDLDLAVFYGDEDRVVRVAVDSGNDHMEDDATFARVNDRTLRTP